MGLFRLAVLKGLVARCHRLLLTLVAYWQGWAASLAGLLLAVLPVWVRRKLLTVCRRNCLAVAATSPVRRLANDTRLKRVSYDCPMRRYGVRGKDNRLVRKFWTAKGARAWADRMDFGRLVYCPTGVR